MRLSLPVALLACAVTVGLAACRSGPQESAAGPVDPPWFEEVAGTTGLDFRHVSGHRREFLIPEIMGGGAALFDMDGDGDLDAYLVQSGSLHDADGSGDAAANALFENRGDGRWVARDESHGAADRGYGMGVAAGDYDADGDVDLYVTNLGPNVLLQNDGTGRFRDVTATSGVGDPGWSSSAVFFDPDRDGDLDLFVANYVRWSRETEVQCRDARYQLDFCGPSAYDSPTMDRFYRNEGDGTFADVSAEMGLGAAFGNGLGVVVDDFDGDGWDDVFVANDATVNQLWINRAGRGFVDEALPRGCAMDEQGQAKAGMGVDAQDVDDDGDPDLLVVNLQDQTDSFFRNDGGLFVDDTAAIGLAAKSRWFTRFGVGLIDFDHDGQLDLYEVNGRVVASPEPWSDDPYAEPDLVLRNDGAGRFVDVPHAFDTPPVASGRAAAFGDVDGDGDVDVLIANREGPAHLLRNVARKRGGWIRLRILDDRGIDALGAEVTVRLTDRTVRRRVRAAYGIQASNEPIVHLGLGSATQVDVDVRWPDGVTARFDALAADRVHELRRPRRSR